MSETIFRELVFREQFHVKRVLKHNFNKFRITSIHKLCLYLSVFHDNIAIFPRDVREVKPAEITPFSSHI